MKKITSTTVGFALAPRINAAGRLASAAIAVELFTTNDKYRASRIASDLCETNRRRQDEENRILVEAEAAIRSSARRMTSFWCLPGSIGITA